MQMARHLFIVSRHHEYLYRDLADRFRDDKNVQVVLDRRQQGERRLSEAALTSAERRARDRRRRDEIDEELRTRSHVIVTLSESSVNLPQA